MTKKWKVEEFYFGNATWPSYSTWRTRGDELQWRFDQEITYKGEAEEIAEAEGLIDWKIKKVGDKVRVIGWIDRTGNTASRRQYEQDKEDSW